MTNFYKNKAPKLVHLSAVLFSILCTTQGVFLCIYPTKYLAYGLWIFESLVFFVAASLLSLYLGFQKHLRRRYKRFKNFPKFDYKSLLWLVWLVYSIGLMVNIAVIFDDVIRINHEETCLNENKHFSGTFNNVTMCRTKDETFFAKDGEICSNQTFCWKARRERVGLFKEAFFGPNILKITLCGTPILMLLLLTSARQPKREGKIPKSKNKKLETRKRKVGKVYVTLRSATV